LVDYLRFVFGKLTECRDVPGIGRDWTSYIGSLTNLYYLMSVYAAQFESLAGRWEQERFDLLQPDSPGTHFILALAITE
jgi:hypothetical protein